MRTTVSTVSFARPFLLPGFAEPHAPGVFEVTMDEERLDTMFEAWRRVSTSILLVDRGITRSWRVEPAELSAALAADQSMPPDA